MKTVGIIAEFNPFHNGHQYLLNTARSRSSADGVIVVMSGHFVQRGAGSVYSKWQRAEAAVRHGADLVLELPTVYALQSADYFAGGGMRILKALDVNSVAFGVENASIDALSTLAAALHSSASPIHTMIQTELANGAGYSSAIASALQEFFPDFPMLPNHILALSYIRAAMDLGFSPEWIPVTRIGALHDREGTGHITSASHVRKLLSEFSASAQVFLPYPALPPESRAEVLETMALSNLRRMDSSELSAISGVSEGLEHRLKNAAAEANFASFLECATTKRYSAARIRRVSFNALLNITADQPLKAPEYLRVLAFNERGKALIREKKDSVPIPFIIKTADAPPSQMLATDLLATDLWALSTHHSKGGQDYRTSPIFLK